MSFTPDFSESDKIEKDLLDKYSNKGTMSDTGLLKKKLANEQYNKSLLDANSNASSDRATSQALSSMFGSDALSRQNINEQSDQGLYDTNASLQNLSTLMNTGIDQEDAYTRQQRDYELKSSILPQMRMAQDDRANRINLAEAQANAKSNESKGGLFGTIGSIGGAALGSLAGPGGAMVGASLGGSVAKAIY